ncbi:sensor histidine kinase [Salinibacterium sp. SWN1162]|uniref:sensor histidine kinase n=1 Tax=Salinibacterium sp. SWN1162 TaxID=2792053 RepID=UPI0018CF2D15|nr:histidine kinase [Salinibacterium sp. SWN1162]MBH0008246.1 histidine kinase [Salinibacterium sp. SWN1162]
MPASTTLSVAPPLDGEHARGVRGVRVTWNYTLGSIVFFYIVLNAVVILNMLAIFGASGSLLDGLLVALSLVAAAAQIRGCWFLRTERGRGIPSTLWVIALVAPAAAVWVIGLFRPEVGFLAAVPLWMAVCVAAPLFSRRRLWSLLAGGLAISIAHPFVAAALLGGPVNPGVTGDFWLVIFYSLLLPLMVLSGLWWWDVVVTLDRLRTSAAALAVAEERLRFASDLHDIQGHHLQVIALKSELAERMLAIDPEAAREHIHETRMIAKQAMEETRSLVAGYREVELGDELENAREVLTAAGAACELVVGQMPANADARRVLGLVVREATTNILRHSEATQVSIRLDATDNESTLKISNDAVQSGVSSSGTPGSGLAGLRDRVAALEGELVAAVDPSGERFELSVRIPARAGVKA